MSLIKRKLIQHQELLNYAKTLNPDKRDMIYSLLDDLLDEIEMAENHYSNLFSAIKGGGYIVSEIEAAEEDRTRNLSNKMKKVRNRRKESPAHVLKDECILLASQFMKKDCLCKAAAARKAYLKLGEKYKLQVSKNLVTIPSENTIRGYLTPSKTDELRA